MIRFLATVAIACPLLTSGAPPPPIPVQRTTTTEASPCRVQRALVRNADLPEGSGVAASRRVPGVLWAHNDSADPVLIKLDANGRTIGRVRVTGAGVEDWEDIAVGPCPQESCLYIGDIGDNSGRRKYITVYRVSEPHGQADATAAAEAFRAAYPDGPHDAESLFVTTDGDVYIVTKGDPGPVALYRFPRPLRTGEVMRLERVGQPLRSGDVPARERPTAADASRDGRWVAIRTTHSVAFYRAADLLAGRWQEAFRADVTSIGEPRGEGIALGANGVVFLVGEGAGSRGGTFVTLFCSLP
jgi:hypothetical protein